MIAALYIATKSPIEISEHFFRMIRRSSYNYFQLRTALLALLKMPFLYPMRGLTEFTATGALVRIDRHN